MSERRPFIGASSLLMSPSGMMLEIQKTHKWRRRNDGAVCIGVGGIGGTIETGESPVTALQRESLEEIGCPIEIVHAPFAVEIDPERGATEWKAQTRPRPIMIWESDDPNRYKGVKVAVFLGRPLGVPRPVDLPALITVEFRLMLAIGAAETTFGDLIERGALLTELEPIPRCAIAIPAGTISVLCKLWDRSPDLVDRVEEAVSGLV